ncbi:FCS-Like Zinc finger 15, partial [Cucurbita argyrosperma subsp. sororia]
MVGLSVILESNQGDFCNKSSQVISKASVMNLTVNSSSRNPNSCLQTTSFRLHSCYLCNQKLLPGKDIYMYKGDRGFCSVECRCRQILMDEKESIMKENSSSSRKTASLSSSESGSSSSSTSMAASRDRKSTRNRRGEFAY